MTFIIMKFGKAFPDQINKVQSKIKHRSREGFGGSDWQETFIASVSDLDQSPLMGIWTKVILISATLIVFSGLFIRLFHLQVAEGKTNRELADSNRIQVKVIHAPRGVIYDRNGKILAQNEPAFRLKESSNGAEVFKTISREESLKLEIENDPRFYNLEIDHQRAYPYREKTSHILGYVSEITKEEMDDETQFNNYRPGDKLGRGGIEESYEKVLKGIDGGEVIEVDAAGKKIRSIRKKDPIPGQNLVLNIDADLQWVAYEQLKAGLEKAKSCCGSLIAQDPHNGGVLALVSFPAFDPLQISNALMAPNSPMLNRAIAGLYAPGSTYKIATTLAGLNSGKMTADTIIEDTGVVQLGPYKFANWYFNQYGKMDGPVNAVKALQRSNDIYYYRLGQTVGEDEIGKASKMLGLGERLGIDIPGEEKGVIPDDAWKQENIGDVWYPGDTLHMSIGQGFVLTTPLQVSNMISFVASDGKQYPPTLAHQIKTHDGFVVKEFKYDPINRAKFKTQDLQTVKKGLEAVTKAEGTAWPFFTFPIQTAGKTGTAEFGDLTKTHAWYTGYGPIDNPQISVTAMAEGGGEGSSTTGPIVKEVMRWYFSDDKNNLMKDITNFATPSAIIRE
jgi:penicillin-binding protein 2